MFQNISQIASRLMRPKIWAVLLLIYCLVHIVLRLLLSNTFQVDGAEQVVDSQFFSIKLWEFPAASGYVVFLGFMAVN